MRQLHMPSRKFLLVTAIALATAGCTSGAVSHGGKPASSAHRGGTMLLLAPMSPGSADPAVNYGTLWAQLNITNDGLVAFRKVAGSAGNQIVADLATSIPAPTDGGRTWAFHVRHGIRYSNGMTLKPSDFTNVFERMFKLRGPTSGTFYSGIVGAQACLKAPATCNLSAGVAADDAAGTVTFHLTQPDPEFLDQLALPFAFAVPPNSPNHDVGLSPLPGTGPYTFSKYTNQTVNLVRNPYFRVWSSAAQPAGYPNAIDMSTIVPLEAEVTEVENGQADGIIGAPSLPADRLNEISTRYASQVHIDTATAIFYAALNTRVAPFNNLQARLAVNFATDRNALIKAFGGPKLAVPSCQMLPPGFPGYSQYCPYTANPAPGGHGPWTAPDMTKAKQLIAQSHTKGDAVTVVTPSVPQAVTMSQYLVDLLNQLGYKASLRTLAFPVFDRTVKDSRYKVQVNVQAWYQDYPAASDFLNVLTGCPAFIPNSGSNANVAEFCDPKIQSAINHARSVQMTNPGAANALWASIDKAVTDQAPEVVLFNPKTITFVSKRFHNFVYNPQWQVLIDQAWLQ